MQLGLYQHYKGNLYHVIGVGRHSESLEEMVIYRGLYADYGLWVRPKTLFESLVEYEGNSISRFKFIKLFDCEAPALR
jgi:hypothetical protein